MNTYSAVLSVLKQAPNIKLFEDKYREAKTKLTLWDSSNNVVKIELNDTTFINHISNNSRAIRLVDNNNDIIRIEYVSGSTTLKIGFSTTPVTASGHEETTRGIGAGLTIKYLEECITLLTSTAPYNDTFVIYCVILIPSVLKFIETDIFVNNLSSPQIVEDLKNVVEKMTKISLPTGISNVTIATSTNDAKKMVAKVKQIAADLQHKIVASYKEATNLVTTVTVATTSASNQKQIDDKRDKVNSKVKELEALIKVLESLTRDINTLANNWKAEIEALAK